MLDINKTRNLLIEELQAERKARELADGLLRSAEYAFTHLPFDHASRRGVLADIRRHLHIDPKGSQSADFAALRRPAQSRATEQE